MGSGGQVPRSPQISCPLVTFHTYARFRHDNTPMLYSRGFPGCAALYVGQTGMEKMKFLIDTHIAIWAVSDDSKLSQVAKEILIDEDNEIYYSTASIWEIIIKHKIACSYFLQTGHRKRVTIIRSMPSF